jgi:hypothetical protein
MDMSKAMLPIGLMTTNREREDFIKPLVNASDTLNVLLNAVAKPSINSPENSVNQYAARLFEEFNVVEDRRH